MNKFKLIGASLAFAALSATANAAIITEAYTGNQFFEERDSYTFGFDLNGAGGLGTNAWNMSLTTDGQGSYNNWTSATLFVDFWDNDSASEAAEIDVDSLNLFLIFPYVTDVYHNDRWSFTSDGNLRTFSYSFTGSDLASMDQLGISWVEIGATRENNFNNDFYVRRVAIVADDGRPGGTNVAEPGSLALFGAGLLGLAFVTRRRLQVKN